MDQRDRGRDHHHRSADSYNSRDRGNRPPVGRDDDRRRPERGGRPPAPSSMDTKRWRGPPPGGYNGPEGHPPNRSRGSDSGIPTGKEVDDRRRNTAPRRGYDVKEESNRSSKRRHHNNNHRDYDYYEDDYYQGGGRRDKRSRSFGEDDRYAYYDGRSSGPRRGDGDDDNDNPSHTQSGRGYDVKQPVGERNSSSRERDDQDFSDWKCEECLIWNYPDESHCAKCGLGRPKALKSDDDEASDVDAFGRRKIRKKTDKFEWPPVFEKDSVDFTFDARSGMFYEATSDFFYDPTSKLYYSNRKQAYFSHNAETRKFVPVDSSGQEVSDPQKARVAATDTNEQDELLLVPNGATKQGPVEPPKQTIAIKLKTPVGVSKKGEKKKKKRSDSDAKRERSDSSSQSQAAALAEASASAPAKPANKQQKQQMANMEKWSERQQEVKGEVVNGSENKTSESGTVRKTVEGKPICMVCKRKFANLEKLKQHEEKSALHKENLEKQQEKNKQQEEASKPPKSLAAANTRTNSESSSGGYIDRAAVRRDMYGPEHVLPPAGSFSTAAAAPLSESVNSNDDNGSDPQKSENIGLQILQKMGYSSGKSLGRGTEQQKEQQAALAQDWDRIEKLASKPQR